MFVEFLSFINIGECINVIGLVVFKCFILNGDYEIVLDVVC